MDYEFGNEELRLGVGVGRLRCGNAVLVLICVGWPYALDHACILTCDRIFRRI